MIFYIFYFLLSPVFFIIIHILKFLNRKINDHLKFSDSSLSNVIHELSLINRNKKYVLIFHAASAGEFEQLKPILKKIDRKKYFIIQSFTSPTIYNKKSNNIFFDVSCYHPYDFWWNSYKFFSKINPKAYIITRQDIWPGHLFIAKKLKIKIFYINANLHKKSIWIKPFIKQFSKAIFKNIDLCLVPSKNIFTQFLKIINRDKLILIADSRFDQVVERAKSNNEIDHLPKCFSKSFNIIFGSYDQYDETYILHGLKKVYRNKNESLKKLNHRVILVPHEVDHETISRIEQYIKNLGFTYQKYSKLDHKNTKERIIIVDKIGILADIYRFCNLAYIGSGFSDGVHSVIEPGIHGCTVGFGPNIELLDEAKTIYENKLGIMIKNKSDMVNFLNLYNKQEIMDNLGRSIKKYIIRNSNNSQKIIQLIEKEI